MLKTSHRTVKVPDGLRRPGLATQDLTLENFREAIDPFLVISLFDMSAPVFPPHPHAGFSVATYIFPESDIGFWNQDTLGTVNEIAPGSLHLTVAGAGLMHEETVARTGRHARGFQIWVDHAAADRHVVPRAQTLLDGDVPRETRDGVERAVLLGTGGSSRSTLTLPTDVRLVDVRMEAGAGTHEAAGAGETAFIWLREGRLDLGAGAMDAGMAAFLGGAEARITALEPSRYTLFAGRPLDQVILPGGPFVASSEPELRAFQAAFRSGAMGRLSPFDQTYLDRRFDAARSPSN